MTTLILLLATSAHGFDPTPVAVLEGAGPANFYSGATFAGDVDGDGFDDVLVGRLGAVDLYYGSPDGPAGTPDLIWYANLNTDSGRSIAGIGDVNGDGYDDVAIGHAGWHEGDDFVHVHYGSAFGPSVVPDLVLTDGPERGLGTSFAHGDVNGDGYDDVFIAVPGRQSVRLFLGGVGGLASTHVGSVNGPSGAEVFGADLAVGDADGDGHLDLLVGTGEVGGEATLALGDGTGASWSTQRLPHDGAVALVDFDGDGAATPVTAWDNEVQLHVGSWPSPGSAQEVFSGTPWFASGLASAGDVDGDGFDDLAVATTFHRVTLHGGPSVSVSEEFLTFSEDWLEAVSVGDVDGDGRLDLIGHLGNLHVQLRRDAWGTPVEHRWDNGDSGSFFGIDVLAVGDVNGDGFLDAGVVCQATAMCVYPGGPLGLAPTAAFELEAGRAAGDVNGDGLGDLIALTDTHLEVYLGATGGPAAVADQSFALPANADIRSLSTQDLNGDGADDLILVTQPSDQRRALAVAFGAPSGLGTPRQVSAHPGTFEWLQDAFLGFADLDGDGFSDLVVSNMDDTDLLWIRGSATGPTGAPIPMGLPTNPAPTGMVRGDFDSDGFEDIALDPGHTNFGDPVAPGAILYGSAAGPDLSRLLLFDGKPLWAGDLDGDGRDDLVSSRALRGPGDGEVAVRYGQAAGLGSGPDEVLAGVDGEGLGNAAAGVDVDGDGLMELVVGAYEWQALTGRVVVYQP